MADRRANVTTTDEASSPKPVRTMSGGQAAIAALEAAGVEVVFGIPGVHNLDIYDALVDSSIQSIHTRHEEGASYMADGYARAGGKAGVVVTTTGPGATNALTGVGTAYSDSIPTLVINAQLPRDLAGRDRGELHDIRDQLGVFAPLVGWNARASSVQDIPRVISRAMRSFSCDRPRPVQIEIPLDVLAEEADVRIDTPFGFVPAGADSSEIEQAANALAKAKRPVILAGGGVNSAGAHAELARTAQILQAPVLNSVMGMGAIPDDHNLALGTGWDLEYTIGRLLAEADVVLAVGCRFTGLTTRSWSWNFGGELIHIDIDPAEIGKNFPATGIVADAKVALGALADALEAEDVSRAPAGRLLQDAREARLQVVREAYPLEVGIIDDLQDALGRDGMVTMDMTGIAYWARRLWKSYRPASFHFPMGFGTLGFGLPAAIGAYVADPDRPQACVAGDGGFMFTGQELATAVQYEMAFPVIIMNDNKFGAIGNGQRRRFNRELNVDLVNPDFVKLAEAYGARGVRLGDIKELGPAVRDALDSDVMTVIEAPVALQHPDGIAVPSY